MQDSIKQKIKKKSKQNYNNNYKETSIQIYNIDKKEKKYRNILTIILLIILIPLIVILGGLVFQEKYYVWISLCAAVISCIPLFYCFERRDNTSAELVILSLLIALSVAGRFIFAWIPGFKPITAITIITGIRLGKEAGFAVGSLSAVISNFYFGQGVWTPFQMFAWGFIGFMAGIFSMWLEKNKMLLYIYAAISGVLFSAIMDVWTSIWAEGDFNLNRYLATMLSAMPVTIGYAVSNIIFLIFLAEPIGDKLKRIKKKYGLFDSGKA